ncbi:RidA family protein [Williamsia serinedens]|uniref:Enamine deaminase RidA, house cleaning of reactive enamine intermediates, YjgF/YER057c/UK114 family n=1 Tax=Williamsia serinedens TaxID=391736 RepID=A0ABT1H5V2_9NOCA|nr:Rid family hydrolase [Williamsia serinedens]MCP2162010.1 Enamine deaminase RidA, house cleaning of reactive enamine intermediates, YjgF/YER057c/UK114 family [Williamsia serinedens]
MSHVRVAASGSLYAGGWSHTATAAPGSVIFTAGAAPIDTDGATVAPGDVQAQARQCMANLEVALRDAGAALTDVAKVTVYVAEGLQADLVVAWDAVVEAFGDHKPVGTLLGVTVLAHDDQLVEIEAVAATPPA